MLAWCGDKLSMATNISLYCKSMSNLNKCYGSWNKIIFEERNVIKIVIKLLDK
jgi:hypothetical protein